MNFQPGVEWNGHDRDIGANESADGFIGCDNGA
jgi:hypothetical protein